MAFQRLERARGPSEPTTAFQYFANDKNDSRLRTEWAFRYALLASEPPIPACGCLSAIDTRCSQGDLQLVNVSKCDYK